MNFETLKSIILIILIAFSLFLTVALWNFQPELEELEETGDNIVEETKIGGTTSKMTDIVAPSDVIFHNARGHYTFSNQLDVQNFYNQFHNWTLFDFETVDMDQYPDEALMTEVAFPVELPNKVITSIFNVNEDESISIPIGGFKRIFFILDQDNNKIEEVLFLSEDTNTGVRAEIQSTSVYQELEEQLYTFNNKTELLLFNQGKTDRIFIPKNQVTMKKHNISVSRIDVIPLINVLLNPDEVIRNEREDGTVRYSAAYKELTIAPDANSISYIDINAPSTEVQMEPFELLNTSLNFVNDHEGWTGSYHLYDISDQAKQQVTYRLSYKGVPILNKSDLTTINVAYQSDQVYMYERPLRFIDREYNTSDEDGAMNVTLESGQAIIAMLERGISIPISQIQDIRIGYRLVPLENAYDDVYMLKPAWFALQNGKWTHIDTNQGELPQEQRGDKDAMGSN
ncbi:YycH family regulatory protein [Thalassobacillus pellis]|uniref:YycH family regulatory protein n=1 Tax=Thalassobacillus pellis TaxID=748008 RepID=UPI00195FDC72|nr:two-component system activity regulator YycH [Thalassobacillus pellis]MBM7552173.1 regulatory protein YycH of two-component signal transduction system YycFG [Thalassobacillus pellis]